MSPRETEGSLLYHDFMQPYYEDQLVRLFLGDCRDVAEWKDADLLLTDPPYGRNWHQGRLKYKWQKDDTRKGIKGDQSTELRDWVLSEWGDKRAAVFGDLMLAPPEGTKQVCIYQKPDDAGRRGAMAGFRRDVEAIYLLGKWPSGIGGRSSVIRTGTSLISGSEGLARKYGHPLVKPVDILEVLIIAAEFPWCVADPFAGSGSTLVAAKQLGVKAVGAEVDEQYAERAAHRLSDEVLFR